MRTVTQYSDHIYKSKASAMRAARNTVGCTYVVNEPEFQHNFDGHIVISADMLAVELRRGGWCWSHTFDFGDVMTRVRRTDGEIVEVRFAEVAHWKNCQTPPEEDTAIHDLARATADYLCAVDAAVTDEERMELYDRTMPILLSTSQKLGVDLGDVLGICREVEVARLSDIPHYIAEVVLRAEPFGLASDSLHSHLRLAASRRGVTAAAYLRIAEENLSQKTAA